MWITESRYCQLSVFGITQSAKRIKSAKDVLRKVLGALMRRPSALTTLGQLRCHFETSAILQPALPSFFQLRYRWFTKGIASSATSAWSIVTAARTVVSTFLLLTRLLIFPSYFIAFRSLWSSTTFPRFLVISCLINHLALLKSLCRYLKSFDYSAIQC